MDKINLLEKSATLYHDNSEFALDLQKKIEDKGYNLKIILSGNLTPILNCPGNFVTGYGNILRFYKLD